MVAQSRTSGLKSQEPPPNSQQGMQCTIPPQPHQRAINQCPAHQNSQATAMDIQQGNPRNQHQQQILANSRDQSTNSGARMVGLQESIFKQEQYNSRIARRATAVPQCPHGTRGNDNSAIHVQSPQQGAQNRTFAPCSPVQGEYGGGILAPVSLRPPVLQQTPPKRQLSIPSAQIGQTYPQGVAQHSDNDRGNLLGAQVSPTKCKPPSSNPNVSVPTEKRSLAKCKVLGTVNSGLPPPGSVPDPHMTPTKARHLVSHQYSPGTPAPPSSLKRSIEVEQTSSVKYRALEQQQFLPGTSQAGQHPLPLSLSLAHNKAIPVRYRTDVPPVVPHSGQTGSTPAKYVPPVKKVLPPPPHNATMEIGQASFVRYQQSHLGTPHSWPTLPPPSPTTFSTQYVSNVSPVRKPRPPPAGQPRPAFVSASTPETLLSQSSLSTSPNQAAITIQQVASLEPVIKDPTYGFGGRRSDGFVEPITHKNEYQRVSKEGRLQQEPKPKNVNQDRCQNPSAVVKKQEDKIRQRSRQEKSPPQFMDLVRAKENQAQPQLDMDVNHISHPVLANGASSAGEEQVKELHQTNLDEIDMFLSMPIPVLPQPEMTYTGHTEIPPGYLSWDSPVITLSYGNHLSEEKTPPVVHGFSSSSIKKAGHIGNVQFWLRVAKRNKEIEGTIEVDDEFEGIYREGMKCRVWSRGDINCAV